MQARRYAAENSDGVSRRSLDDLPAVASDDELIVWSKEISARSSRPNRPLVARRINSTETTEEIFSDIAERANAVYARHRLTSRR
jgi:hypothetical protein